MDHMVMTWRGESGLMWAQPCKYSHCLIDGFALKGKKSLNDNFHFCFCCAYKNPSSLPMLQYLPKQQCLSFKPQIVLSCTGAFPAPALYRRRHYGRVGGPQDVLWITGCLTSRHPREQNSPAGHPAHMSTCSHRVFVWGQRSDPPKCPATIINPSWQCCAVMNMCC